MSARPPVYISAPINALLEGLYRQDTTIGDIRRRGNLGIGTFNDLDGELVLLDGTAYQLRTVGDATIVPDEVLTPFAMVTLFDGTQGDVGERLEGARPWAQLEHELMDLVPSRNLLYSFRIEGRFDYVRARSVNRQDNYRPLAETISSQKIFEFRDIDGVVVGFWTPAYLGSVHVPGFHFHFISADRREGGHLLAMDSRDIEVRIQHAARVDLGLPMTLDFMTTEFTRDLAADINKVEK